MKVLLCGGGNAIHVLTSYVSSHPDTHVTVLSLFPGEAERFRDAIPDEGIKCINDLGPDKYGKPDKVTDKPEEIGKPDMVIFAVPSFCHEMYLKAIKPFIEQGVTIGAMPAEGGFDLCAIHNLGSDFVRNSNLFALETLPWACRIIEYGKSVEVLGTKKQVDAVVSSQNANIKGQVIDNLHKLLGELPVFDQAANFLGVTLMNINAVWHPTISYGFYRNRDITEPFDEPPLFYYGADEYTGDKLAKVSDEVMELKRVLLEKYPGHLDLDSLHHVSEWMTRSYGDDIGDKTSIYTMLRTNKGYRGLTHAMREVEGKDGKKQYLPNFKYRYFTEDIPMGLMVTRGIAELAGVPTPHMDDVIIWCSKMIDKEYLVDGKLTGKDLHSTRAPQHYGYTDLDTFMKANHYLD